jgi:hypothetical protein
MKIDLEELFGSPAPPKVMPHSLGDCCMNRCPRQATVKFKWGSDREIFVCCQECWDENSRIVWRGMAERIYED